MPTYMFDVKYYLRLYQDHISSSIKENYEGAKRDSLKNMRDYLDSCGIRMPKPKWKYDEEDMKTWKYLDAGRKDKKTGDIIEAHNPLFAYGHL